MRNAPGRKLAEHGIGNEEIDKLVVQILLRHADAVLLEKR